MKITEEHIEFVSKANGYCKKMDYQKGSTEYNIAWLAYMAAISNNGEHWYLKHLKSDKTIGDFKEYLNDIEISLKSQLDSLLCEVSGIFDGWHSDGTYWTEYDESVRKRIDEFRNRFTYIKPETMSTHEQRLKELDEMDLPTDADFKSNTSEEINFDEACNDAEKRQNEKKIKWLENLPVPKGGGLLQRLADKDKALSEFYDLQDPFRRGFMLAEEMVKKWCEDTMPLNSKK